MAPAHSGEAGREQQDSRHWGGNCEWTGHQRFSGFFPHEGGSVEAAGEGFDRLEGEQSGAGKPGLLCRQTWREGKPSAGE